METVRILLLFISLQVSGLLASFNICRESCSKTYSVHTNDQVDELNACYFGCRVSYIVHLTTFSFASSGEGTCKNDCSQAYAVKQSLISACTLGCKSTPLSSVEEHFDDFDLLWHRQIFRPVYHLSNILFRHANAIFITSSSYDNNDGSEGVVMQFRVSPQVEEIYTAESDNIENVPEGGKSSTHTTVGKMYHHAKQWLNCVEKRIGLPYWFLCSILFVSFALISWVCCAHCEDDWAENSKIKKHNFVQEMEFQNQDSEKVPLFFVNNNNEEAGPLPAKQPLI